MPGTGSCPTISYTNLSTLEDYNSLSIIASRKKILVRVIVYKKIKNFRVLLFLYIVYKKLYSNKDSYFLKTKYLLSNYSF
jgi:hypothetical protein